MNSPLRVLVVEDSDDDYALLIRELQRGGLDIRAQCVDNRDEFNAALEQAQWDVVIADYSLPQFSGTEALALMKECGFDLPFLIISGTIGEETAVEVMKAGAHDYLMKDNLKRLVPAIEREVRDAEIRRQRRDSQEALRKSKQQYEALVNTLDGIVWEAEADTYRLTFISSQVGRLLGYSPESCVQDADFFSHTIHEDDFDWVMCFCSQAVKENRDHQLEYRMIKANGSIVWMRDNIAIIREGDKTMLRGILTDITDRKEAEEALKQTEEQLRHAQKMEAVGRMAGGIAHDFNNLLTAIIGYAEVALNQLNTGDPVRHYNEEIRKAGSRAAELTAQLLAFSRKQVRQPRPIDLNQALTSMEDMLRRLIGKNIELALNLPPDLGTVKADPGQIEQVIVNLTVNARDAMPNGGRLTIETANVELDQAYAAVHLGVSAGHYVLLSVSDTGCGMEADVLPHIFEPFYTTKPHGQGTGLGLAIVYGIVKQNNGDIAVVSEPQQGTTFTFHFPCADEPAEELRPPSGPLVQLHGTETILLVEDDESIRNLTQEMLCSSGYAVLEAANAGEALLICERHSEPIQLLLTDVIMPQMYGYELAQRLSPMRPEMKILFMSGYTGNPTVERQSLPTGAAFIQKPFTPLTLAQKVREVLNS